MTTWQFPTMAMSHSPNKLLGETMDARYAERQTRHEPVTGIIQTKGSSDTHPYLSPNDEFASFELFDNMINVGIPSQLKHGFVRQGLVDGMILENQLGHNPFKFAIVAGADVHSGYSGNEEWVWDSAHGLVDDTPQKRLALGRNPSGEPGYVVGSAGATAVWAEENTRAALFDGIKRKETDGTSGPLLRLRLFGGWNYSSQLVKGKNFVKQAYEDGVPMGSNLPIPPEAPGVHSGASLVVAHLVHSCVLAGNKRWPVDNLSHSLSR